MIENILPGIYRIEVPLTGNPMKNVNAYLIKGKDRHLLVDTGWNHDEALNVMLASLEKLDVDPAETDFFLTHMHVDHTGLVGRLASEISTIYFNRKDAQWIEAEDRWIRFAEFARHNGFPEQELEDMIGNHPGFRFGIKGSLDFTLLKEAAMIEVGDYHLRCLETPGHSPGHMCLYEPEKKLLFSGDHILEDITPTIQLHLDGGNPLKEYLDSLRKIRYYPVRVVLPGHRRPFRRCHGRIREIERHHRKRSEEVLSILKMGPLHAYEVASRMMWDIFYVSWDQLPPWQRWFATGEANAHLKYLQELGLVGCEMQEENMVFSLVNPEN